MAGAFVGLVLDAVRDVSPGALLTLVSLADRANKDKAGLAWPSVGDMAERTNRHDRQVRRDLRELEAAGWIRRCGAGLGGQGKATTYELNVPAMLYALLHSMPVEKAAEKAALHYREMRKLPGLLGPGFTLHATANNCANPVVGSAIPGSHSAKPGTTGQQTRSSSTPELEVDRNLEPEAFEPEGLCPPESKKKSEPEGTVPNASDIGVAYKTRFSKERPKTLTREEQLAFVAEAMAAARAAGKR